MTKVKAYELGQQAHANGIKAAPALDQNFMDLLAANRGPLGWSIPFMKAWSKGWHAANASSVVI